MKSSNILLFFLVLLLSFFYAISQEKSTNNRLLYSIEDLQNINLSPELILYVLEANDIDEGKKIYIIKSLFENVNKISWLSSGENFKARIFEALDRILVKKKQSSSSHILRQQAAIAIGSINYPDASNVLETRLFTEKDPYVRKEIINTMRKYPNESYLKVIELEINRSLFFRDILVACVDLLGTINTVRAKKILIDLYAKDQIFDQLRKQILEKLSKSDSGDSINTPNSPAASSP